MTDEKTITEDELFGGPFEECPNEDCDSIYWKKSNVITRKILKEGAEPQVVNIPCFICEECGTPFKPR